MASRRRNKTPSASASGRSRKPALRSNTTVLVNGYRLEQSLEADPQFENETEELPDVKLVSCSEAVSRQARVSLSVFI